METKDKYSLDLKKSIWESLPPKKRKVKRHEFIYLLLSHYETLNKEFIEMAEDMLERIQMTCETIHLEWYLNKKFDPEFETNWPNVKPIYIQNEQGDIDEEFSFRDEEEQNTAEFIEYAFLDEEDNESYSEPWYSFRDDEFENTLDFKVYVSASLGLNKDQKNQVKGILENYMFLGKEYLLIEY